MNPIDLSKLPSYAELPVKAGAPANSAWGLFGEDDQVGTINLLVAEKVKEAATLVRKGKVFSLNLPLDVPNPALFDRKTPQHTLLVGGGGVVRDDYLDSFYLQASSQWDSLRHIRHPVYGFYNGVKDEEVSLEEGSKLGIENWAKRGIVGRGVLLDVAKHLSERGTPIDPRSSFIIRREMLAATADAQKVEIRPGDILLIRTGWLGWYLQEASPEERQRLAGEALAGGWRTPGIGPCDEMAEYLWNLHIAAVAADNPSVDVWPPTAGGGFLHFYLLPLFGMPIGEMWYLEELAADCAGDGVYEFMLTSAPLHLRGGVGSPPNALAIK
ncbi:MAG: cyclase family protein [Chloroflexota bacterium]|nr:cyclase family protein [Chloroflexota bacterium]